MRTTREGKWTAWVFLAVLLGACGGGAPPNDALEISGQFQLFVDDHVVQEMHQVARRLNPLKKHPANPILKPDRSWEGQHTTPTFVAFDRKDRLYKMWYVYIHRNQKPGEKYLRVGRSRAGRAYAFSRDGIVWEKPDLGLIELPGHGRKNNAVPYQPSLYDLQDPDPQRRYKAVIGIGDRSRNMGVAFSPDGLHWTPYEGNPVIDQRVGAGKVIWDDRIRQYVGYLRPLPSPPVAAMGNVSIRVIGRTTSPDFLQWELPQNQVVLVPDELDPLDTQFYTASVYKDRGVYFAFLSVYHVNSLMVDIQLAFSRDGIEWQRVGKRQPVLTYGMPDRFDSHGIYVYSPPVVLEEEIRVYYQGQDEAHSLTPGDLSVLAHRPAALPTGDRKGAVRLSGRSLVVRSDAPALDAARRCGRFGGGPARRLRLPGRRRRSRRGRDPDPLVPGWEPGGQRRRLRPFRLEAGGGTVGRNIPGGRAKSGSSCWMKTVRSCPGSRPPVANRSETTPWRTP